VVATEVSVLRGLKLNKTANAMEKRARTLANGAKQFVVHDALDTTVSEVWYSVWLTPTT